MFNEAKTTTRENKPYSGCPGTGVSLRTIESLWVRLKAGDRVRPKDAQLLRRLGVPPFDRFGIYELNASGYVIGVGMPDRNESVDAMSLLRQFENRFGVPETFSRLISHGMSSVADAEPQGAVRPDPEG